MIVDEADVLRYEGEAYAARLRAAGVAATTVRYDGITHDFMMLNPLSGTHAIRARGRPGHLDPARCAPRRLIEPYAAPDVISTLDRNRQEASW